MNRATTSETAYTDVRKTLLTHKHVFSSLPTSPHKLLIPSSQITSLSLHPVLESALHLLNLDLPAAHFLLRHMQSPPAYEAMFLHGILHRIEGDYDNTRAWYRDVSESKCFRHTWPEGLDQAMAFLDCVEIWRKQGTKAFASRPLYDEETEKLRHLSLSELSAVLAFCESEFGTAAITDATSAYVKMDEKYGEKAKQMVTGGEGWREF